MRKLGALQKDAVNRLREGTRTTDAGVRSSAFHAVAAILVEARQYFTDSDGFPDWRGRSYPYRQWVGGVYGDAGVPPEDRARVSASLRYHIGNALREALDPETLESLGLSADSPLARAKVQRGERADLLRSVTGSTTGLESVDALRAIASARGLLLRVSPAAIADLTPDEAGEAGSLLDDVSRQARALRRKVTK